MATKTTSKQARGGATTEISEKYGGRKQEKRG